MKLDKQIRFSMNRYVRPKNILWIIILGLIFLAYVIALFISYSDALAKKTFKFSITYLSLLFVVLLIDHYFI